MVDVINKQNVIDQINALTADGEFSQSDVNYLINYLIANGDLTGSPRDLIQIRRGNKADLPNLAQGELGLALDEKRLYVGGLEGNIPLTHQNNGDFVNVVDYGADPTGNISSSLAIEKALSDIISKKGGRIYFPAGSYRITQTIKINTSNIILFGDGPGNNHDVGLYDSATLLFWDGAADERMISIASVSGASNQGITRCGVIGMHLDCRIKAGTAIEIKSLRMGIFRDLYINEAKLNGIYTDVVESLGESSDTQSCEFSNISVRLSATSGNAFYLTGSIRGNTSYNVFNNIDIMHTNGKGMVLATCDNNMFTKIRINRGNGNGLGLELLGSEVSPVLAAASNNFVHLTAPSGVIARGGTYPSTNNNILFYDVGNGSPFPTIESKAILTTHTVEGIEYNSAISKLAIGDGITPTKDARKNMGVESVRIRNISGANMVLEDNLGNSWSFRVSNNGLEIFRLTGVGPINLHNGLMLEGLQVSYGANDSAGEGFRTLRITNP